MLESLSKEIPNIGDVQVQAYVTKLSTSTNLIKMRLESSQPELITLNVLNSFNSWLQSSLSELNNYIGNKNIGQLTNSVNNIDSCIINLGQIPVLQSDRPETAHFIADIKAVSEKAINALTKEEVQLRQSFAGISKEIETSKNLIAQQELQIAQLKLQYESSLNEFKASYKNVEKDFLESSGKDIKALTETFNNAAAEAKLQLSEQISKSEKNAVEVISFLDEKKRLASDLLQIIGNIGITGNYNKIAESEKKSAENFRMIAIFLMILVAISVAVLTWHITSVATDIKLEHAIFRFVAGFSLLIPAAYAAKEAAKHRDAELRNRKFELELASLEPFLEKLPEEKRNNIKEKLTERFFGQNIDVVKTDSNTDIISSLMDLLKTAIKSSPK